MKVGRERSHRKHTLLTIKTVQKHAAACVCAGCVCLCFVMRWYDDDDEDEEDRGF